MTEVRKLEEVGDDHSTHSAVVIAIDAGRHLGPIGPLLYGTNHRFFGNGTGTWDPVTRRSSRHWRVLVECGPHGTLPLLPAACLVQEVLPDAEHVRTGLHRARGETTKPIERSHVFTRDRLRAARGVKTLATGQRFFEGFEALHALRRGHASLTDLVPGYDAAHATVHERVRAVARVVTTLGAALTKTVTPAP